MTRTNTMPDQYVLRMRYDDASWYFDVSRGSSPLPEWYSWPEDIQKARKFASPADCALAIQDWIQDQSPENLKLLEIVRVSHDCSEIKEVVSTAYTLLNEPADRPRV